MEALIPYEFLEHTADVKFRAYGKTPEEMLSNAARALFASMIEPGSVRSEESWRVDLFAEDLEQLAYLWLCELVYLFEVEIAVFSKFDVTLEDGEDGWKLGATVQGERIDKERHAFDCEVKAVTLHQFEVIQKENWTLQAVVDV